MDKRPKLQQASPPGWKAEWDRLLRQIAALKAEKARNDEALAWIEQRCHMAKYTTAANQEELVGRGVNLVAMALAETTP